MTVDISTGKYASGMDRFGSVINRTYMTLGGKFLDSLRFKTQFLLRRQRVIVVDGATHSQKDGAEACVLFLHSAQLVLRSSVFTVVLDLGGCHVGEC